MIRFRRWLLGLMANGDSVVLNATVYGQLELSDHAFVGGVTVYPPENQPAIVGKASV